MNTYTVEKVLMGRLPTGSDLITGLTELCQAEGIQAGQVSLIGALRSAKLGWWDDQNQVYHDFTVDHTTEILHGAGNISLLDGKPFVHLHLTLSHGDHPAIGGHVFEGCEVYVTEYIITALKGEPMTRHMDQATGLKLWKADSK